MKPNSRYRLIYSVFTGKFSILLDTETKTTELNYKDIQVINEMKEFVDMTLVSPDNVPPKYRDNFVAWAEKITQDIREYYYPDEYPEPESYEATQEAVK